MKTFVKTFRGKISHEKIDTYVNLVLKTLDPDDYYDLEFQQDDGWHVDHIDPISLAMSSEDVEKLSHYTNLRPLWATENLKKSNKII